MATTQGKPSDYFLIIQAQATNTRTWRDKSCCVADFSAPAVVGDNNMHNKRGENANSFK
jgi:hypothetical protein